MKQAALISLMLMLSACGFRPLYETGGSADAMREHLATVSVAPIADRLGQVMHNRLSERFGTSADMDYLLEISLDQVTEGYGFREDASVTQEELLVTASVRLVELDGDRLIFDESMRARTSYDIVLSDFSTVIQREDSARRLVLDLSDRIERRLALYFSEIE